MKKVNWELVVKVRQALEEIPVKTYHETNLKLGMMQALDQVIEEEQPNENQADERDGD